MNVHQPPTCEGLEWNKDPLPPAKEPTTGTTTSHHRHHSSWGYRKRTPPFRKSKGIETSYLRRQGTPHKCWSRGRGNKRTFQQPHRSKPASHLFVGRPPPDTCSPMKKPPRGRSPSPEARCFSSLACSPTATRAAWRWGTKGPTGDCLTDRQDASNTRKSSLGDVNWIAKCGDLELLNQSG
jgi:hypothetical protein